MNINSKLISFAQNELMLSRKETERDKINRSLAQLENVLKYKLGSCIDEYIRFGSFTRDTILPRYYDPNSDVDLMIVFKSDIGIKTPGTYRKWILDCISNSYPNSISKKDFPVVKLQLNHIMFDIVPAYSESYYFGNRSYYIPDSGDSWRSTTPNDINELLRSKNAQLGSNMLINTIRLCKHWNASAGYPLESYLMEKKILNLNFWGNDDIYSLFLKTINCVAGHRPGVRQALNYIERYKGDYSTQLNEDKQIEWLRKLLPSL